MPKVNEATYLGACITAKVNPRTEIRKRISQTMPTLKKLDVFWNKAKCNKQWKILVLNAVIMSKLTYGLETIEPTTAVNEMLNTLQLKGLRQILDMTTTYVEQESTNENVYQKAETILQECNNRKETTKRKPIEHIARQTRPVTSALEEKN